jgi:prepilin-type N-terminal cleavage/methylation domain-containing protein
MKTAFSRWRGYTLVEVMVAATVLSLCSVGVTGALLQLNRRAAISRVMNAAKAEALSRIQQVQQLSYDPDASPVVIPSLLSSAAPKTVDLGSTLTDLGSIPATETWTVSSVPGNAGILSVTCTISYKYMNRNESYQVFTYKAPN